MLLGHPQADVGAAGDDGGIGLGQQHLGQLVDRGRRDEPALPVADGERLLVLQRLQPRQRVGRCERRSASPRARLAQACCAPRTIGA